MPHPWSWRSTRRVPASVNVNSTGGPAGGWSPPSPPARSGCPSSAPGRSGSPRSSSSSWSAAWPWLPAASPRGCAGGGPAEDLTERLAFRLPVTLYLGWATAATAAGFGATFRSLGMPERGGYVTLISLVLVLLAAAASIVAVGRLLAVAGFAFAVCWALVAVVVATSSGLVSAAAVVAPLLILAVVVGRR